MIARFVANEVRPDLLWTFGLTAARLNGRGFSFP